MRRTVKLFCGIILLSILALSSSRAESLHYMVMVDAGSSGSRIFVLSYDEDQGHLPIIKVVDMMSSKKPLTYYKKNRNKPAEQLLPLISFAQSRLENLGVSEQQVPFYLLATAGMRLHPAYQQLRVYKAVKQYLHKNTNFKVKEVATISGQKEAVYDWLSLNYALGKLQLNEQTVGALDLGGASTQIAFEMPNTEKNTIKFNLFNKDYNLYANSFLGFGTTEAFKQMKAPYCFANGFAMPKHKKGAFNYAACKKEIVALLEKKKVETSIPVINNKMQFFAFSRFYTTYQDFNVLNKPTPAMLSNAAETVCQDDIATLKTMYPKISYIDKLCFSGVYIPTLLTEAYHFAPETSQVNPVHHVKGNEISWIIGAALYKIGMNDV